MRRLIYLACSGLILAGCEAPAEGAPQSPPETAAEATEIEATSVSERALREAARRNALAAKGIAEIGWEDLLPEGEEERLAELYVQQQQLLYSSPISEGSAADQGFQIGTFNTVAELDGAKIRIPGYTVPFIFGKDAEITSFLLVPYFGACIHSPPPPPNQTIFVTTETPIKLKDLDQAVWIEGTLKTQSESTDLADAAYTIVMDEVESYDY